MATFIVNQSPVSAKEKKSLLRFLRDELHLNSVKDGCSEGACGTCTVLIDGKPTRACIPITDKLEGKQVLTVEGISEYEKEVYRFAFGDAGAVQCGFCIPGMILCTKALLDNNQNPSRAEAAHAIRNNYCRCTGYVKIIDAILLAAQCFREGKIPTRETKGTVGDNARHLSVDEKIVGAGVYADDIHIDGMIYASAVRAAYPRARVLSIDSSEALSLPGVVAVYTADDVPGQNKIGHLVKDWDTFIAVGDITRYLGDAICVVAAETPEILEEAKALVQIDYEVLSPITCVEEAMAPDAPALHAGGNLLAHRHLKRGDAKSAIEKASHVVQGVFKTPYTEHAFLEPECSVALPDGEGVKIWSSDQSVYDTQHEIMGLLGLPAELVKVENPLVGGGFGGKEDMSVQHHAALVAFLAKRPVKVKLTRKESILIHPKRHPMEMDFTLGCDEKGVIQGVMAKVVADTGAYASLGGPVLERACTHASGPYNYQNFEISGDAYYTNNPPAGAFRGFGVTQTCFAIESLLNQMADIVGISAWEIRYRNAIRPGQALPNGQIVDDCTGLVETLLAVKDTFEKAEFAGIACAMKNAGMGVGLPDTGRVRLEIKQSRIHIFCAASCMGQGIRTVLRQIVCDQTGIPMQDIVMEPADTVYAPDSGTSSGSRHTTVTGEACYRACAQLQKALQNSSLEKLEGAEYMGIYVTETDRLDSDVENPVSHVAYGYATQLCTLDKQGNIESIVAAHNVGRAVNPIACEGQIEGGVVMSMGYALTENYPLDHCKPTAKFGTLGLFRAHKVPFIQPILVEKVGLDVAGGAIGVGEITSIPTAPAIADAYFRFDGQHRYSLPLENTPYAR